MKRVFVILIGLLIGLPYAGHAEPEVSLASLLREMTDRTQIALFPAPTFECRQFSSYDRASIARDSAGWFANWDRSMFLRVERDRGRTEYVMMDAAGPGAVVRFWMTFAGENCGRGTLRIYVDDMSEPIVEGAAFDILSGGKLAGAPLCASVSELTPYEQRGHNLYFPIPYAERCKVTYESEHVYEDDFGAKESRSECVYYNINYRTYAPSTKVRSFRMEQLQQHAALIARTQRLLSDGKACMDAGRFERCGMDAVLAPGKKHTVSLSGGNAVRRIRMHLAAEDREQALRSVVLQIRFDGEQTVWIPVGAFFGIGDRSLTTSTWYTSVDDSGLMEAYWVMPFEKECVITLENYGTQSVQITDAAVEYAPWHWNERSMHFGAAWHEYAGIDTGSSKTMDGQGRGLRDLSFVHLTGQGVYVGDEISLFNTTYHWWGEGDEKIFVDGEPFPSHIGTGTEDYYGYAWCRPERFTGHPFIAQPCGDGNFAPTFSVNSRWRVLDAIPFRKSLDFDMELWHWAHGHINYAPATFWYLRPGGTADPASDPDAVVRTVTKCRSDIIPDKTRLSVAAEAMNVEGTPAGHVEYNPLHTDQLSGEVSLYWTNAPSGTVMETTFHSDWECSGPVTVRLVKAPEFGRVNIRLNGVLLTQEVDLYASDFQVVKFVFENGVLRCGENRLTFEITAPAPSRETGGCGCDLIVFEK